MTHCTKTPETYDLPYLKMNPCSKTPETDKLSSHKMDQYTKTAETDDMSYQKMDQWSKTSETENLSYQLMDQHAMTRGIIPVRHSSLPGLVKLPRRYEKAALGNQQTVKHRKISICPFQVGDSTSERLEDLGMAIIWIKQELIMLRQHDILLKRQFLNLSHSILSLRPRKDPPASTRPPWVAAPSLSSSLLENSDQTSTSRVFFDTSSQTLFCPEDYLDFPIPTGVVRPATSVSLLSCRREEDAVDSEDDDHFCESLLYRPRTSSMRTSRDLAALARRRGSKELI